MIFYDKLTILQDLDGLYKLLQNNEIPKLNNCIYIDRIFIKHYIDNDNDGLNIIRIWKTKALFDYFYDDFQNTQNFIASIDYLLTNNNIKIQYLNINEDYKYNFIEKSLISFIKKIGKENNKKKVIVNIHNKLFNKYYIDEGFIITERQCSENPYLVECEFILDD